MRELSRRRGATIEELKDAIRKRGWVCRSCLNKSYAATKQKEWERNPDIKATEQENLQKLEEARAKLRKTEFEREYINTPSPQLPKAGDLVSARRPRGTGSQRTRRRRLLLRTDTDKI
jgi:hypothetical protein